MAYTDNKTGDKGKSVAVLNTALVAPMVLPADLLNTSHMINQASLSGKEAGCMVLEVTTGTLAAPKTFTLKAAKGSAPADAWVAVVPAA